MRDRAILTAVLAAAVAAVACGGATEPAPAPETLGEHAAPSEERGAPEPSPQPGGEEGEGAPEEVPPEPSYTHGKFVWFEHWSPSAERADRAERFYEALFGWSIEEREMQGESFREIRRGDQSIGLLATPEDYEGRATWMGYVSVPDVDGVVDSAAEHGGEPVGEPMEIKGIGRFAHMKDPTGAFVGVVTAVRGDPPHAEAPEPGAFAWMELWARGPKRTKQALAFYTGAVGHEKMMFEEGRKPYPMLAWDGRPFAGVSRAPKKRLAGRWVPYVVVEDVDATVKKARKVKGMRAKLVAPPENVPQVGRVAVLVDPTGALVGLIAPASESRD